MYDLIISNESISSENEEVIKSTLFPEGFNTSIEFQTYLTEFLNDFEDSSILKFYEDNHLLIDSKENEILATTNPEIVDWIVSRICGNLTAKEKRIIEQKNIEELRSKTFFFKMGRNSKDTEDLILSLDVMKIIFSYIEKTGTFMNTFGLVNEAFYYLSLITMDEVILTKPNVSRVPILTLNSVKSLWIPLNGTISIEEIKFAFSKIEKLKKLVIVEDIKFDAFKEIATAPCVKEIDSLQFHLAIEKEFGDYQEYNEYFGFEDGFNLMKWIITNFPNLKTLDIKNGNGVFFPIREREKLKGIKPLQLKTLQLIYLFRNIDLMFDLNTIENLSTSFYKFGSVQNDELSTTMKYQIKKLEECKNLKKLEITEISFSQGFNLVDADTIFKDEKDELCAFGGGTPYQVILNMLIQAIQKKKNLEELFFRSYLTDFEHFKPFFKTLKNLKLLVIDSINWYRIFDPKKNNKGFAKTYPKLEYFQELGKNFAVLLIGREVFERKEIITLKRHEISIVGNDVIHKKKKMIQDKGVYIWGVEGNVRDITLV